MPSDAKIAADMPDIVDELRAWPARGDGTDGMSAHTVGGIMEAAAVEIERLRAVNRDLFDRYASLLDQCGAGAEMVSHFDVEPKQ